MKFGVKTMLVVGGVAGFIAIGILDWRSHYEPHKDDGETLQKESFETKGIPDFEFKTGSGKQGHSSDFKGQIVIVNFWASWCGPCLEEMPSLISLIESQAGRVQLIAVSGDSSYEDIDAFLKAFPRIKNPNISIVWDEDRSIAKKYFVDRLPVSFIAGKDFKVAKKITGTIDWHTTESESFIEELSKK